MVHMTHPEQTAASEDRPVAAFRTLMVSLIDGAIAVECDSDDMSTWLREMMAPAADLSAPGPAAASVVIRSNPVLGPAPVAEWTEPCFALDTKVEFLPASRATSTLRLEYFDKSVSYSIGPGQVTIAPTGPSPDVRIAAFMAVRELAVTQALVAPRMQFHAAGFAADGDVALLTGPKGAGKTTTLAHLTASTGSSIVTNDRAIVSLVDGSWQVRGVPTIVGLRPDSIARLPRLFEGAVQRTVHLTRSEVPGSRKSERQIKAGRVPSMSLAQLADRVGSPLTAGGRLASISVLRIDESVQTFALRQLTRAEAKREIYRLRFGMVTEPRPLTVFETLLGRKETPAFDRSLLDQLVSEVPCVEVRVGSGLPESEQAGQELAAALLALQNG
jgi:hypothetical protein